MTRADKPNLTRWVGAVLMAGFVLLGAPAALAAAHPGHDHGGGGSGSDSGSGSSSGSGAGSPGAGSRDSKKDRKGSYGDSARCANTASVPGSVNKCAQ